MSLRLVVSNGGILAPGTTWVGDEGPTDLERLSRRLGDQRDAAGIALHRLGWIRLVRDPHGLEIRCDPRAVKANPLCLIYAAALLGGEPVAIASGIKAFRCFAYTGHGWLRIECQTASEAIETLYRLLEMVDAAPSFDADIARLEAMATMSPSRLVLDTRRRQDAHGVHLKAYLGDEAVALDPQLRFVQRYCERVRRGDVLRESEIDLALLRERAPDCAICFYSAAEDPILSMVENWDPIATYRNGVDLTGATLKEIGPGIGPCIAEDVRAVLSDGRTSHWTMLRRAVHFDEVDGLSDRGWLRLMVPFIGSGDRSKILIARNLKSFETVDQYLPDLGAA